MLITHYQRLLSELTPDRVHILIDGRIVDSGGPELAERLEARGLRGVAGGLTAEPGPSSTSPRIRKDFPILDREINGQRIVYLDSAASSQKPRQVLEAMERFYETSYAHVHRSAYQLADRRHRGLRGGPAQGARFVNAPAERELVFTKNATEALNLVAQSWGGANLGEGDVVVLTQMEHHANIVPWQMLAAEQGIELRWVPLTADGLLDLTDLDRLLDGAKAFCFTAMSNVLGTHQPGALAHRRRPTPTAPSPSSTPASTCPTCPPTCRPWAPTSSPSPPTRCAARSGIGVLWGREELLEAMPPVPRRRPHDRRRAPRRLHARRAARRSSRPARRRSPRPSGSARPSTT